MGSTPGSGRSPGGGHDNLFQYSCLENPKDGEAWWATVHRVAKSLTWLKRLSTHCFFFPVSFTVVKFLYFLQEKTKQNNNNNKKNPHYLECIRINLNTKRISFGKETWLNFIFSYTSAVFTQPAYNYPQSWRLQNAWTWKSMCKSQTLFYPTHSVFL